ncbi:MAG: hypothetical protein SGI89_04670 [bacterium]|nr:hypothetical protein [bacterium]
MTKKLPLLYLLILPLLLFFLANLLVNSATPYFLNDHYDPNYVYLLNSLNLAQLKNFGVGHIDHPGTTLQVLGAVVVKVYYSITSDNKDIVLDVFERAEDYLRMVNFVIIIINSVLLFLLGLIVYRIYSNIFYALLLQFTPFVSPNIYFKLWEVTPENFLIVVILIIIILSLKFINDENPDQKKNLFYVIGFSLIMGFGIATKINFIPLLAIPLILFKTISKKLLFIFLTGVSAVIFVIPAIQNYKYFFGWVKKLTLHTGLYGSGEDSVINTWVFTENLSTIFYTEKIFTITFLMILCCLILRMFYWKKGRSDKFKNINKLDNVFRLLSGIFLSMTFEMIMVGKHFVMRYMLPVVMLTVTAIFLIIYILNFLYGFNFEKFRFKYVFIFSAVSIMAFNIWQFSKMYNSLVLYKNKSNAVAEYIDKNYNDPLKITGYMSYNKNVALFHATPFAGSQNLNYKSLLAKHYPKEILYTDLSEEFYDLNRNPIPDTVLLSAEKIIFQSNVINAVESLIDRLKQKDLNIQNADFKLVFQSDNHIEENVYEITLSRTADKTK